MLTYFKNSHYSKTYLSSIIITQVSWKISQTMSYLSIQVLTIHFLQSIHLLLFLPPSFLKSSSFSTQLSSSPFRNNQSLHLSISTLTLTALFNSLNGELICSIPCANSKSLSFPWTRNQPCPSKIRCFPSIVLPHTNHNWF
jgi:hypothetical protein